MERGPKEPGPKEPGRAEVVTAIEALIGAIDETCEDADAVTGSAQELRARTVAGPPGLNCRSELTLS